MKDVIAVSPFKCRMWAGHERLEDQINEATCKEEIESVLSHGQLVPVLARPLRNDSSHQYELVYGARRLFVARHLNMSLLVELREVSDREAIIALDIENRHRKDFSPYERGRSYSAWLRAGLFESQDELARVLNVSASQVSRLLRLSQLPTVLVKAFSSPTEICESWGRELMEMWDDPNKRKALTTQAREITHATGRQSATSIYQRLISPESLRKKSKSPRSDEHDEVIKDAIGNPLFRVSVRRKGIVLLLPIGALSSGSLSEIKSEVAAILQRARSQTADSPRNVGANPASSAVVSLPRLSVTRGNLRGSCRSSLAMR